jgi:hypothetical protein
MEKTLSALSRSAYSWSELQQRPLPDGVDPAKMEKYLSDEEFQVCRLKRQHLAKVILIPTIFPFSEVPGTDDGRVLRGAPLEAARDPQREGSLLIQAINDDIDKKTVILKKEKKERRKVNKQSKRRQRPLLKRLY